MVERGHQGRNGDHAAYPRGNRPKSAHPEGEAEAHLRQELASALYARGLLPFGKASELAETSRILFSQALRQRSIPRHYGTEDLNEDLKYASGERMNSLGIPAPF